jgi:site-specific DNA recombinase
MPSEHSFATSPRLVVVYERVSTEKQDISRQAVQRERAATDYPDREIVVVQDDGVSAFKTPIFERPGGKRLCSMIEDGKVEALFVDAQDRLSRGRPSEWWNFADLCELNSTRIIIDGRELRLDEESDQIKSAIDQMVARRESAEKSHRVRGGKRRAAEQGRPHGGWPAYGYRYGRWQEGEHQGLLIVPEQAEVVRRIYREWRHGRPQKDIARGLNADGVPPQRAAMWQQSSVGCMLRNPVYVALRQLDETLIAANHEPILPRDEWEEAQRLLAPRGSKKRSGRPAPGFLLRGLLICGECGARMHTDRGGRGSKRYVCYTREKNPDACSQLGWRQADLDEGVLMYFEDACIDAEASWQASREAADARVAETRVLREQAEREAIRLAAQLDRADEDYGKGDLDAADYKRLRAKWADERDAALAEVERLTAREVEIARAVAPDFAQRLAAVREAVAGRVRNARDDEGVEAVRAALQSLFDAFIVYNAPTQPGTVKSYRLVPQLREDVAGGEALIPGRKVALVFPPANPTREAEEKYHVAEALSYRSPDELSSV